MSEIKRTIQEVIGDKEWLSTSDTTAIMFRLVLDELGMTEEQTDGTMMEACVRRGLNGYVREVMHKGGGEALLEGQGDLFSGDAFVCLGGQEKRHGRLRVLTLPEYDQAILYKEEKAQEILNVRDKLTRNKERVLPFWGPEMTYGEAKERADASEKGWPSSSSGISPNAPGPFV